MKFSIRELRPDDEGAYADLCAARPGLDRAAAEARARLVQHLAFQNPTSDGAPTYFVVAMGDRLMGHMGRMPTWFWVEGKKHLATFAHDLFVHPELQHTGQGFFATMRLYQSVEKASKSFVAMCWTNDINIRLQQTRHYDQLWVDRFVRPMRVDGKLGPLRRLGSAVEQAGGALGNGVLRAIDLALHVTREGKRPTAWVTSFDARFDDFAERSGPTMGIAPVKDAAYLRYKYLGRPGLETVTVIAESAPGHVVGFAVLRAVSGLREVGTILDLAANPEDTATYHALLGEVIAHYARSGVGSVEAMGTDPRVVAHLARYGFVRRGDKMPFFYANGRSYERPAVLARVPGWHHVYGDSEGPY